MGLILKLGWVRGIVLGPLIVLMCAPLQPSDPAHIKAWQKQYFLNKNLGQQYLGCLAAFIAYLTQTRPDDATKNMQEDVSAAITAVSSVNGTPNKVPNSFRLALIKVFKNAYGQAYKDSLKMEQDHQKQLASTLARRNKKGGPIQPEQPANEPNSKAAEAEPKLRIDRCSWKQALNNYYAAIYPSLDPQHRTYLYGHRRGKTLPAPKAPKMAVPAEACELK